MKILVESDPHIKETGSMANESRFKPKYSTRLDLSIKAFGWLYQMAKQYNADMIVHNGDLTDKPLIRAKEAHAIKECFKQNDSNIPEYVVVGNHDRLDADTYALSILENYPNVTIINEPTRLNDTVSFMPYTNVVDHSILEKISNKVLFSHVDILGAAYNKFTVSPIGYDVDILSNYFKLVINGHIHMPGVYKSVMNIGAFNGSGLGDDYSILPPSAHLIDTDAMTVTYLINPYAIHYRTIVSNDLLEIRKQLETIVASGFYTYVRIQCINELKVDARLLINQYLEKYQTLLGAIIVGQVKKSQGVVVNQQQAESAESIQILTDPIDIFKGFVNTLTPKDTLPASKSEIYNLIMREYIGGTQ